MGRQHWGGFDHRIMRPRDMMAEIDTFLADDNIESLYDRKQLEKAKDTLKKLRKVSRVSYGGPQKVKWVFFKMHIRLKVFGRQHFKLKFLYYSKRECPFPSGPTGQLNNLLNPDEH